MTPTTKDKIGCVVAAVCIGFLGLYLLYVIAYQSWSAWIALSG